MTDRQAASPVAFVVFTVLVAAVLAAGRIPAPATAQPATPAPDPFAAWPKGAKPDAVLIISGQTYGYLQPCGCSRPQLGGLERRANLVKSIRDRGWPVAGFDLGDIPPAAGILPDQVALKYGTTMNALREMGYVAVGVGRAEFNNGLFLLLNQYAAKKEQPPYTLAGNANGFVGGKTMSREDTFLGPGNRPMVGLVEVTEIGAVPVGVAGVVGPSVQKATAALGQAKTLVGFTPEKDSLDAATKQLAAHAKKPQLNVLLYQGTADEAKKVAKDHPQFRIIAVQSEQNEPKQTSEVIDVPGGLKTLIVRVGYKGRYVGVVGAFKKADGTFDLKYEIVAMAEGFSTAGSEDEARKANAILPMLDDYAETVKGRNMLGKFPQYEPPGQTANPKLDLSFVGSEACAKCHTGEHAKWKESRHSHAYEALEKLAKRPALRQYDGECAICHTVGLGYKSGFRDETSTAHLKHVGCESCHGPGAGHAADKTNLRLIDLQSSWRKAKDERLPDAATMEKLAGMTAAGREKALKPAQWRAAVAVGGMCMNCHDQDNDPNFDLFVAWPKVVHPPAKK